MSAPGGSQYDAIIVGAGHNGLVAATLLAREGRRVLVLERCAHAGGAAVSASPFAGVDARLSRYSYLVSLFPRTLLTQLGIDVPMRRRRVSSYTPLGDDGLLICDDEARTRASFTRTLGSDRGWTAMQSLSAMTERLAGPAFGSLTKPLVSRDAFAALIADPAAWTGLFERPLGSLLQRTFADDLVRGIVATDALIGTFAAMDDPALRQNRCFLYHVIGNGTGRWDVPVGGMGAVTDALITTACEAGAELRLARTVIAAQPGSDGVTVECADGSSAHGRHLLCGAAPAVLARLLGDPPPDDPPEGCQLKLNLLLSRLPALRDSAIAPEDAFAGTLHVNEGYGQLETAHREAAHGALPSLPPCEAYCHSLTDPSILSPPLRAAGVQTLTIFGLHMPARLFAGDHAATKARAVSATLASLDTVLAEPILDCLLAGADGEPCLEARTPLELEAELGLPAGHIFHRDLAWPFAEHDGEVGSWGAQTARPNVWICGAGARRGGGVSGIAGHNAARAVLAADAA
ncbi:MAG: NAD(P)/FAD-dependent oxidoreductase [Solirubrobacteraceae bacterium]